MNCFRLVQIVTGMVRAGLFGETYYAEGEYLHAIRDLIEKTPWRRKWQVGINGITYGTHSLGPILQWMPGDRVVSVSCVGAGRRRRDAKGELYETEAPCVMLCRMRSGGLVKIALDLISDGPARHKFRLQGTDGCLEIPDFEHGQDRAWLRSRCNQEQWRSLNDFADEFLPEVWRRHGARAAAAGHEGSDFIQMVEFVEAIRSGQPSIGIHEAMDMTLPGLVSQRSIVEGGKWIDVPDSREW
jgi:predicted dehydrogenase